MRRLPPSAISAVPVGACVCALLCAIGCGDDEADPRTQCSATLRTVVSGRVGPTRVDVSRNDPFAGGQSITTTITLLVQAEDTEGGPHLLALTSNTVLDVSNLWNALDQRFRSGAADADQLTVAGRPFDVPCDPREGVICAAFGIDTNGDGILFGPDEVVYPAESGELDIDELSGNAFNGDFEITFGPAISGGEADSDSGGTMSGCFQLLRDVNRRTLF